MSDPRSVAGPADVFELFQRPAPEVFEAVGVFVDVFGKVGVESDVEAFGELGRGDHQSFGDRERRTGSEGDAHHGSVSGVVMEPDQPFGLGENRVVVLDDRIWREPAVLLRQAHRAASGMETETELPGGLDLGGEEVATALGVHIEMIGGCGASAEGQLGESDPGGEVARLLVEPRPLGVQGL